MWAWLRRGVTAVRLAGERSDLWPAGALGSLAYLGWLPLLLVLVRLDVGDLTFLASTLRASSAFPANVIALGVAVVAGVLTLTLLAAIAEAALVLTADASEMRKRAFSEAVLAGLTIILVCALPAAVAIGALLLAIVSVAPAEFQSPDFGTPLALRLAGHLLPFLLAVILAVLAGQAIGAAALRRALAPTAPPVGVALAGAARELIRRPWGRLGVAATGQLVDLIAVALTNGVLRVLWAPIAGDLSGGRLARPETILLLVGFVAIWLALLLAAGALHVAISAWWALELADAGWRRKALGGSTDDARPLP